MRPSSKVILPYEPGYTGHWEMEKRYKETKEWLRRREQEIRDRLNSPSIVCDRNADRARICREPSGEYLKSG
jgi:hypothetical protein